MKAFHYSFKDSDGLIFHRKVRAPNLKQAQAFLKRKRLNILSIKEEKKSLKEYLNENKKVPESEIVAFSQLFAGCIQTGLTIKESLTLLSKQVEYKQLENSISEIIIDLDNGSQMSDAFKKQTKVFPAFYPMLIKAGEASGNLAEVLDYIGHYLEKINDLKKQIQGIIAYPIIVSIIGMALLTVILIFVAPTFKEVFESTNNTLPIPTIILFFLSDFIVYHSTTLLILMGSVLIGFYVTYKNLDFKKIYHRLFIFIPLFGKLIREVMLLRFLRGFDILINNDVPILQALQVLEDGTTNLFFKDVIHQMRKDVSKGMPISGHLVKQKDFISPMVAHTIAMGEKAGNLGPTLSRISLFVDREINHSMKRLASRLDPLLTFGLGIVVLLIALAIYLPIFDMMTNVGR